MSNVNKVDQTFACHSFHLVDHGRLPVLILCNRSSCYIVIFFLSLLPTCRPSSFPLGGICPGQERHANPHIRH